MYEIIKNFDKKNKGGNYRKMIAKTQRCNRKRFKSLVL